MDQKLYNSYVKILKNELVPALGCTEPIAIAYAAAKAHEVLGQMPEKIELCCSGNIIKNVKGVKAVSYTHLDVYKRQAIHRISNRSRNPPGRLVPAIRCV